MFGGNAIKMLNLLKCQQFIIDERVNAIKRALMVKILCDNSNIQSVQPLAHFNLNE